MTAEHDSLVTLDISGMTCAACAARLERVLAGTPGVTSARVSLALERADITTTDPANTDTLVAAVDQAGFHAILRGATSDERRRQRQARNLERADDHRKTATMALIAGTIAAPFLIDMARMMLAGGHHPAIPPAVQAVLASIAQLVCGARFYRGAWAALRGGSANMDVLVAIGTTAAYGLSLFNWLAGHAGHGGALYFEASVTVLAFLLLGKVLEGAARNGTSATLEALASASPRQALRLVGGKEAECDAAVLAPGDVVRVRPGAQVPADGRIIEGQAAFDEALITGESLPVTRTPGEAVIAGSIASTGSVLVEVTATGDDTRLQRISRLIEDAEIARSPSQQMADRISAIFVPVVLAVAAVTAGAWFFTGAAGQDAIIHAVSVLVVACPCALGLATPIALVAGANAAARTGIIITDYSALEAASRIDRIVFDKTGTLTLGRPVVSGFIATGNADDALCKAASLAASSDHPLDRALVAAATESDLSIAPIVDFTAIPGKGLKGTMTSVRCLLGQRSFLESEGVSFAAVDSLSRPSGLSAAGSLVFLAEDGIASAVAGFSDQPRANVADLVAHLEADALAVTVLSGDRPESVRRFAEDAGIADARGGLSPDDKIRIVRAFRATGESVAMVGDGINDAPALRAADLGIAMASGTETAKAAAAVTLARPDLRLIPHILAVGRDTRATIHQNLALAFVFNSIGIPLAAFGHLSPAVAGAAMALSSVSVVLNAWRLARRSYAV